MFDLLQKLCCTPAAPGREMAMTELVRELLTPLVDECTVDPMGNVLGFIAGTGEKKEKLLFSAHMDEVAFMVAYIEDSGYVRFTRNGGSNFFSAEYREVVSEKGVHGMMIPVAGGESAPGEDKLVIDIGADNRAEAEALVEVGDTFTLIPGIVRLAGTKVAGRPIDDRIGCAVQLEAARLLKESGKRPYHDLYLGFSCQEEITGAGGSALNYAVKPDIGIAVDVCGTGDTPGVYPMAVRLGGGAAILARDTAVIADYALLNRMKAAAKANNIPYQIEVYTHGGTDAVPMQRNDGARKASVLSIPMRGLHTSAEVSDLKDAEACTQLILALSAEMPPRA